MENKYKQLSWSTTVNVFLVYGYARQHRLDKLKTQNRCLVNLTYGSKIFLRQGRTWKMYASKAWPVSTLFIPENIGNAYQEILLVILWEA